MRISCFLIALFVLSSCGPEPVEQPAPPNILFIAVDDLRPELAVYGAQHILSPEMDRLAGSGAFFTRAYCNVPVCGASRASLLSGLRPTRNRFWDYDTRLDEDAPDITTLPQHFRENGYHTVSLGKIFHHQDDAARSWTEPAWRPQKAGLYKGKPKAWRDYALDSNWEIEYQYRQQGNQRKRGMPYEKAAVHDSTYYDGKIAQKAIRHLQAFSQQDEPFFLAMGFVKPHLPFNAPAKYWDLYEADAIQLAENPFHPQDAPARAHHNFGELRAYHGIPDTGPVPDTLARKMIHGYFACISYVDALLGQVLSELDRLELRENTIVILWGDHGWMLGEHGMWCKHSPFEKAIHTPLMIAGPGIEGGTKIEALTEFVDIYPSLCELAGLPLPDHLAGESVVPLLNNPGLAGKSAIYSRWKHADIVRSDRYHYTQWLDSANQVVADMLYDQQVDAEQNANISGREDQADRVREMRALLNKHLFEHSP